MLHRVILSVTTEVLVLGLSSPCFLAKQAFIPSPLSELVLGVPYDGIELVSLEDFVVGYVVGKCVCLCCCRGYAHM